MSQREPSSGKKQVWSRFIRFLQSSHLPWPLIVLSVVVSLVSTRVGAIFPDYQQKLTSGDISTKTVVTAIVILLASALSVVASTYINGYTTAVINRNVLNTVWGKVLRLPMSVYQKTSPRELISRITVDTGTAGDLFVTVLTNLLSGIYGLFLAFSYIFSYNKTLVWIQLGLIPLALLIKYIQGRVVFSYTYKQQTRLSALTAYLSQILVNIPLVKVFLKENFEKERGEAVIKQYNRARFKLKATEIVFNTLDETMGVLNTLLSVIVGASLIRAGEMTVAVWISYFLYTQTISSNLGLLTNIWPLIKGVQGSVERVVDFMEEEAEVYEGLPLVAEPQDLVFSDVTFSYQDRPILSGLNLTIPKGKLTAIVGASGAGKSTLLALIERFFPVDSGAISYGDQPIGAYDLQEWRSKIAYVTQELSLFSGSIRDNITYGLQREVGQEELVLVAEQAAIHEAITALPEGYDTVLAENGEGLSGGERQRLILARLFLKQPEILLLDEATSNLDADSEQEVLTSLQTLAQGRTVVAVAHRLRTIEAADQIVVLDKGRVVAVGSHDQLKASCVLYQDLLQADLSM